MLPVQVINASFRPTAPMVAPHEGSDWRLAGNLALLCHHHRYLKTYEGWTLGRPGPTDASTSAWIFTPLPPFGQEPDPPGG